MAGLLLAEGRDRRWPETACIERLLQASHAFLLVLTQSARIVYVSQSVEVLLGYPQVGPSPSPIDDFHSEGVRGEQRISNGTAIDARYAELEGTDFVIREIRNKEFLIFRRKKRSPKQNFMPKGCSCSFIESLVVCHAKKFKIQLLNCAYAPKWACTAICPYVGAIKLGLVTWTFYSYQDWYQGLTWAADLSLVIMNSFVPPEENSKTK